VTGARRIATLAFVGPALLTGCRDDGRTLDPAPPVPESRLTTTSVGAPGGTAGAELTLTSPAFADGATLDPVHSCDGADVPPALTITGVPPGAAELALTVTDLDAGGYVHWVIAGIPPTITVLEPGLLPPEAVAAVNDAGEAGWTGPCPREGDGPNTYELTVHATYEPIGLAPGTDGRAALDLIRSASVASDVLTATYP
jgi:Raf kinase inhibitor-like YbhB/YbcL family protein